MATIPTVQVWSTGQFVTSSQMNAGVGNVLSWLMSAPRAIVYRDASVTWNSGANPFPVSWTKELVDTDTMWTNAHPSRLTFNTAGLFLVENAVHFSSITTGAAQTGVALNSNSSWPAQGSTNRLQETTTAPCTSSFGISMSETFSYYFNAGDYIETFAAQTSGSANTAFANGTYFDGHLGAKWIATS